MLKLSVARATPWVSRWSGTELGVELFPHVTGDLDVIAAGVTKATALESLLGAASRPYVVAFGNDLNDRDLLRGADRAVVVGSGLTELDREPHVRRVDARATPVAHAVRTEVETALRAERHTAGLVRSRSVNAA